MFERIATVVLIVMVARVLHLQHRLLDRFNVNSGQEDVDALTSRLKKSSDKLKDATEKA